MSIEDELEKAKQRVKQLLHRQRAMQAREREAKRKRETRAKIILGALALAHLDAQQIHSLAARASERDREALREFLPNRE